MIEHLTGENNDIEPPITTEKPRSHDLEFMWIPRDFPELLAWHPVVVQWIKGETHGVDAKIRALITFFEKYLANQGLPLDPVVFFARETNLPDFYKTACPASRHGIGYNNYVQKFLAFFLLRDFSILDDSGSPVVSPAFRNPIPILSRGGLPKQDESVFSPLPYGYVDELRQMVAAGPTFGDWKWAQNALGAPIGEIGRGGGDWFVVNETDIDKNDPDCVWRERTLHRGDTRLEMWSPVRWVALLVKLIIPLRTFQVRMLDSGEADTWRFERGTWLLNNSRLAQGTERNPLQQGVFRRTTPLIDGEAISTVLYINTNKTADVARSGPEKGYVLPWASGGLLHQDVFYWLERLRNWQEKYNPIERRSAWAELDHRHIHVKSEVQLSSYPDTCFLFRMPEETKSHLPGRSQVLDTSWYWLLKALELRLARRGETHRNGSAIRFLPGLEELQVSKTYKTLFPLHSLRVSLITALALEGQVPFPILQKLVGHSRLVMTLYYTKPGATRIHEVLAGAAERLEKNKETSIQNFLLDTEHNELVRKAICNNQPSLSAAIPEHPAARNPVGWMPMHHGLCLVGGNTSELEDNGSVGGCYNGGTNVGSVSVPRYTPVPGGSRNCVRCRWFVTEPHYVPALAAHFNTVAYHFDEARNTCLRYESELEVLKKRKADREDANLPFEEADACRQAERLWESAMKRFSDLAEDMVACYQLIDRCKQALEERPHGGTQLVAAGTLADVHLAFEETESELLQLAGVCQNVEIYPDLEPGKAVFRRSQLLDAVLYRDGLPPLFMLLSEQEQLLAGNAFIDRLGRQMNPSNPALGQREVIRMIDAGASLSQHFGIDLTTLLPRRDNENKSSSEQMILGTSR